MRMLRLLAAVAALSAMFSCSRSGRFTISGDISGLAAGDTIRFSRIILPGFGESEDFSVVIGDAPQFTCCGELEHDQYYVFRYFPKTGKPVTCDRTGKVFILRPGDEIQFTGNRSDIYYCRISGGIYDDPLLSEFLRLDDSLGMVRGNCIRMLTEASERRDTAEANKWHDKFNSFQSTEKSAFDRLRRAEKEYEDANLQGSLFLLVDRFSAIGYNPVEESKEIFDRYSDEVKNSYYGKLSAEFIAEMELLTPGNPAPDFTLVTVGGDTVTKSTYSGKYLLLYHWGLCPGSVYIDPYVRELYERYKDKGLAVVGLTESIGDIRDVYESTSDERFGRMIGHAWPEAELETDCPGNKSIVDTYHISGWPFFILIGPDGTLLARNFTQAFYESSEILERNLAGERTNDRCEESI